MRNIKLIDTAAATLVTLLAATPAMAGITPSPAPVMGAGIGALALMGVGYFAIRRRGR